MSPTFHAPGAHILSSLARLHSSTDRTLVRAVNREVIRNLLISSLPHCPTFLASLAGRLQMLGYSVTCTVGARMSRFTVVSVELRQLSEHLCLRTQATTYATIPSSHEQALPSAQDPRYCLRHEYQL